MKYSRVAHNSCVQSNSKSLSIPIEMLFFSMNVFRKFYSSNFESFLSNIYRLNKQKETEFDIKSDLEFTHCQYNREHSVFRHSDCNIKRPLMLVLRFYLGNFVEQLSYSK